MMLSGMTEIFSGVKDIYLIQFLFISEPYGNLKKIVACRRIREHAGHIIVSSLEITQLGNTLQTTSTDAQ